MRSGAYAISLPPSERARAVFDPAYYAIANPDVLANGIDLYEHFMTYGWREGRNPSATFNTLFYKDSNTSCGAEQNPLLHACSSTAASATKPESEDEFLEIQCEVVAPFFDEAFYAAQNPDSENEPCLRHYLRRGWQEGREPNAGFSGQAYLAGALFVTSLGVSPFYHLASTNPAAAKTSRAQSTLDPSSAADEHHIIETIRLAFDASFYRDRHTDIQDWVYEPIVHFVRFGWQEGRDPSRFFDVKYYLSNNEDVERSGINPLYHYIVNGRQEGRKPLAPEDRARLRFDRDFYLEAYADVAEAGIDPFEHYMLYGWKEGRNPSPQFMTLYFKDRHPADDGGNPFIRFCDSDNDDPRGVPASDEEFLEVQKRIVAPFFDAEFYAAAYGLDGKQDPITHYLASGWRLGHEPNKYFSTPDYLRHRLHVRRLGVSALYHSASLDPLSTALLCAPPQADRESRALDDGIVEQTEHTIIEAIRDEFDEVRYLRLNADVRTSGGTAIVHFVRYGWKEGRDPNSLFDTRYFLAENDDVRLAGINPFFHYVTRGRSEGRKPNPAGAALWPATKAPGITEWSRAVPAYDITRAEVAVIMPVYDGFDDTLGAIFAVLTNTQRTPFVLIVINDQGPDERLAEALRDLADKRLFVYIENEVNLGFVRTANKGMANLSIDVVLLNADAVVHNDWLDRLLWHAGADPSVATVTPLSNNASICGYPVSNHNNVVALEVGGRALDAMTAVCNKRSSVEIPTGVGFCIYIRRAVLDRIGPFDEQAFGRGYGEENDLCMRALKEGYRNLLAQDVYVYHAGEVSLGSFHAQEFEPGQYALRSKHPDYPGRCRKFVESDLGHEARLRLDLMRLAQSLNGRAFVFITHSIDGGIATHIQYMASRLEEEGSPVLFIQVGRTGVDKVSLVAGTSSAIYMPSLTPISLTKHRVLLTDFLVWLKPRLIHVHSFVGLSWQATRGLVAAIRESHAPYAYTFHDYSSVCHRNHLVRPDGIYCGLPSPKVCNKCIRLDREYDDNVYSSERRHFFESFFAGARMLFAPSLDVKARMEGVFKAARPALRYHQESVTPWAWRAQPRASKPLRVAIIGAIGPNKGSGLVCAMALDALRRTLDLQITIIGYSDIKETLADIGVTQTGRYATDQEAFDMIEAVDPHIAFFASIWPETFSYTLSLALAAGIPPVVLDLGAPAERLRRHGVGEVLPLELANHPRLLNDALLAISLDRLWAARKAPGAVAYTSIHRDYYGLTP